MPPCERHPRVFDELGDRLQWVAARLTYVLDTNTLGYSFRCEGRVGKLRLVTRPLALGRLDPIGCVRQECVDLRLGVPQSCRGEAGIGGGKRCKWWIHNPLEPPRSGL